MARRVLTAAKGTGTNISYRSSTINLNGFAKHISGFWINSVIDNVSELIVYRESRIILIHQKRAELLNITKKNMQKPDKIYTILLFLFSLQA